MITCAHNALNVAKNNTMIKVESPSLLPFYYSKNGKDPSIETSIIHPFFFPSYDKTETIFSGLDMARGIVEGDFNLTSMFNNV